ncbi:hypothetical protein [Vulcanococcus limneticus]|jgi:hypothetical protein|uniref:hypothetical protein n=1 Tax=Vulcanococcus limneticus TaxID=2170428 RepID=UPI00398C127F
MAILSSAELPIQEATVELIRWFIPLLYCLPRLHPAEADRANLRSWNAHLAHVHTWRLRRRLFAGRQ